MTATADAPPEAVAHRTRGLGTWPRPSNGDGEPDVVLGLRRRHSHDLMRLEPDSEHPHGLSDRDCDAVFTTDRPLVFANGYHPSLIHRLTYRRRNHANIRVPSLGSRAAWIWPAS